MNWGECKSMVQTYVHRQDQDLDAAQIPACDRLTQMLDVQDNEAIASGALAASVDALGLFELALQPDYGRMKTVRINGRTYTPTSMLILAEQGDSSQSYAISGNKLYAPVTGTATYGYGKVIQPISADASSSAILTRYPRAYLYAVVIEALIQSQDFDAAGSYASALEAAVDDANALQAWSRFDSSVGVTPGFRRV